MIAPVPLHLTGCRCDWRHLALDVVSSTNDIVLQQAEAGAAEGLVVTARSQTAGRGRRGREWQCEAGDGLLMSLLLRPSNIPTSRMPWISLLTALALFDAIDLPEARVKWPNDLLLNERKVAGILTELRSTDTGPVVAVGIGLNLSTPSDGWPAHLRHPATALDAFLPAHHPADTWMEAILRNFDRHYAVLLDGGYDLISEAWWKAHGGERDIEVDDGTQCWRGTAIGLSDNGALQVRDAHGAHTTLIAADVTPCC